MRVPAEPVIAIARHDLGALVAALGQREFFTDRLTRQRDGHGVLLVAWVRGTPVGDVYLWLGPADEPELRTHLPGVPLLNHLEVHADHQGSGVGTALVRAAEREAAHRGHASVALGVGLDNARAKRLYLRLGYTDWGHGPVKTSYEAFAPDGTITRHAETIDVLVRTVT